MFRAELILCLLCILHGRTFRISVDSLCARFCGLRFALDLHSLYEICIKNSFFFSLAYKKQFSCSFVLLSLTLSYYLFMLLDGAFICLLEKHICKIRMYVCVYYSKGTGFLAKRYRFVCSQQRLLLIFLGRMYIIFVFPLLSLILDSFWKRMGLNNVYLRHLANT